MTERQIKPCSVPAPPHDGPARLYPCGWRCVRHTPAAQAGRPEPVPGPGYTPQATPTPLGDSRVADVRAVASGKRRASITAYRAAQAAVTTTKGSR